MPPILIIFNLIAVILAAFVVISVSKKFRKLFILGCLLPLAVLAIVGGFSYDYHALELKDVALFMLRGGIIFAVFSGMLTCYIASKLKKS